MSTIIYKYIAFQGMKYCLYYPDSNTIYDIYFTKEDAIRTAMFKGWKFS